MESSVLISLMKKIFFSFFFEKKTTEVRQFTLQRPILEHKKIVRRWLAGALFWVRGAHTA